MREQPSEEYVADMEQEFAEANAEAKESYQPSEADMRALEEYERTEEDAQQEYVRGLEENADTAPDIELTIENWDALFGEEGIVATPIGEVKMGESQFTKLMRADRNGKLGMIKPTLEHPHAIVEDTSEAKGDNVTELASSYVFIRSFKKADGSRYYYFTSVTVSKDGKEVVISNQEKSKKRISNLLQNGVISWINKNVQSVSEAQSEESVPLDDSQAATQADNNTASLGINSSELSESKDTTISPTTNELDEKNVHSTIDEQVQEAEAEVNTNPTEAQKEAGNYKKGHVQIGTFNVTIEQPKGSVRSGVDADGKKWETEMQNTYGYIRGAEGVDGDHIDVFLSDDIDGWDGHKVFVVDQRNADGSFDEHKVMLGFNDINDAEAAYMSNYEEGWQGLGAITGVSIEEFEKWIASSHRKTKAFAEYKSVKTTDGQSASIESETEADNRTLEPSATTSGAESEQDNTQSGASATEVDNQGNPVDAEGNLVLEKVGDISEISDEDFINPTRNIELPDIPMEVSDAIGSGGKPIVIKRNVFEKNRKAHEDLTPQDSRKILTQALYNPALYGQNQKKTRPYNWILIHLADRNSAIIVEVNENKDNIEIVNWHYLRDNSLRQKQEQAIKEGGLILTLGSAVGNTLDGSLSTDKGSEKAETTKGAEAESVGYVMEDRTRKEFDLYALKDVNYVLKALLHRIHAYELKMRDGSATAEDMANYAKYKVWHEYLTQAKAKKEAIKKRNKWGVKSGDNTVPMATLRKMFEAWNGDEELGELFDRVVAVFERTGVRVVFDDTLGAGKTAGYYAMGKELIKFPMKMIYNEDVNDLQENASTILHEMIHATTQYAIELKNMPRTRAHMGIELTPEMMAAVDILEDVYRQISGDADFRKQYGATNVNEMVAELSNPKFRELLKRKNLWGRVLAAIKRLFGIEDTDALSGVSRALERLLDDFNLEALTAAEGAARKQSMHREVEDSMRLSEGMRSRESGRERAKREVAEEMADRYGNITVLYSDEIGEDEKYYEDKRKSMGWVETSTGKIVVVLDNNPNAGEIAKTILHEVVAHRGIPGLLGKERANAFYAEVYAGMREEDRQRIYRRYKRQIDRLKSEEAQHRYIADEYTASVAEGGVDNLVLRRLVAKVREVLRDLGINLTVTDSDIVDVLRRANAHEIRENSRMRAEREVFAERLDKIEERKTQLAKAEKFIEDALSGKNKDQSFQLDLPAKVGREVRRVMGRDFDSHNVDANSFVHARAEHGVGGKKITPNSIPLRDEDFVLAPYIMFAPHRVERGSIDSSGRESVRFIKYLSDGEVVVVEKEQKNSPQDMDTITMWADLSSNVLDARQKRPLSTTSETVVISRDNATKIRKDAEVAIEEDEKNAEKGEIRYRIANAERDLVEEKENLQKKGVNIDEIEQQEEKAWNDIASIESRLENIDEYQQELTERFTRENEEKRAEEGDKMATYLAERKSENASGFYKVRPKEEDVRYRTKETAPKTVSVQDEHLQTVVSSADGAKVLKDLDSAITEYENNAQTKEKTFLGKLSEVLNAKKHGSNSQYATFEAVNGKVFTIRLSDHNAKVSTYDNHKESEGLSIVVTAKGNRGIENDGDAHVVEYFYDAIKLRKAEGKPLAEILKSIKQALYSGEYIDTTGLAEREEVNDDVMYRRWYGGNSGYVGYSKSKRAVDAEERGLRNASQMNGDFAKEVNSIIEERTGQPSKLTLKAIKGVLSDIRADEWHHTSKYGNRTNYYSAETVASYFAKDPEEERAEREEQERIRRRDAYVASVREKIPTVKVETIIGGRDAFITSAGYAVEVPTDVLYAPEDARLLAVGELKGEEPYSIDKYAEWYFANRDAFNKAVQEYVAAVEKAKEETDTELSGEEYTRDGEGAYSDDAMYRIREEAAPKNTGIGYKVFVLKNGELYPPMVANPNGEATPIGVWLDADAAPVAGQSKTGRSQVKAGGKGTQGGSGKLAYRPGWHLGEIPYALQFNRNDENGERTLFPANFVWAEVEYANDVDYQEEAMSYGYNQNGKFQHSYAGLPRVPENGAYHYRTNPNPDTDPWIITGAMRVKRLLTPTEVDEMVKAAGREPQRRQEGAITDE